jgi:hypothetical protein
LVYSIVYLSQFEDYAKCGMISDANSS